MKTFIHGGRTYTVELEGAEAKLSAFGLTTRWPWADYYDNPDQLSDEDWAGVTTEMLMDEGLLAWSEILDDYVPTENQDDCEAAALREAAAEREHIRQESRSDLFL